ncbi:MAG: hypothetical protein Q7S19_04010 [bacterium]|nr:hypothetical protein [bacterium]
MFIKDQLFLKDKEALHHAYLITGDIEANVVKLRDEIGDSADNYINILPVFKVEHSRELIERQKTRSFTGGRRFFIIAASSFINEAQNALLKVLEDPIAGNHFFILCPTAEILLPTLRSRLMHIEGERLSHDDIESWCDKFIKSSVTDRMVMIDKFLKDEDEEDNDKLIKHKTTDILSQIEKTFGDMLREKPDNKTAQFLAEIIRMKGYLNDTSPSPRLILEYIAFIC